MAFRQSLKYLYFKIIRQEGTPTSIARGVAIGLAVGFIVPIGFQTIPAILLAFLFRANKILSWTFTCVTNPATVFFIYPVQCYIGGFLLLRPLRFADLSQQFQALVGAETLMEGFHCFCSLGVDIILPFFAGGVLFAMISVPLGYGLSYRLVREYQRRKELRRLKRAAGRNT